MAAALIAETRPAGKAISDLESAVLEANKRGYAFNRTSLNIFHKSAKEILEAVPAGARVSSPSSAESLTLDGEIQDFLHLHRINSLAQLELLVEALAERYSLRSGAGDGVGSLASEKFP